MQGEVLGLDGLAGALRMGLRRENSGLIFELVRIKIVWSSHTQVRHGSSLARQVGLYDLGSPAYSVGGQVLVRRELPIPTQSIKGRLRDTERDAGLLHANVVRASRARKGFALLAHWTKAAVAPREHKFDARPVCGRLKLSRPREATRTTQTIERTWCGRRDSNPHDVAVSGF